MGFADALDREAAWLATTGDSLPDLTKMFDVVQARWSRTPPRKDKQLYVLHDPGTSAIDQRTTNQHTMLTNRFLLELIWPIQASTGDATVDQLAFEQAIDATLLRVYGLLEDHTHGGRFLSVAEDPVRAQVAYQHPQISIDNRQYQAQIRYAADDFETVN